MWLFKLELILRYEYTIHIGIHTTKAYSNSTAVKVVFDLTLPSHHKSSASRCTYTGSPMSISISSGCRGTNLCRPRWVGSKSSNGLPMVTRPALLDKKLELDNASPVTATRDKTVSKNCALDPYCFYNNRRKFMYSRLYFLNFLSLVPWDSV